MYLVLTNRRLYLTGSQFTRVINAKDILNATIVGRKVTIITNKQTYKFRLKDKSSDTQKLQDAIRKFMEVDDTAY